MLGKFLYPYLSMLSSGAWSLEQSLDGLGLISLSIFMPMPGVTPPPTPTEGMLLILSGLFLFSVLLSIPLLLSGYVIRRRSGLLLVAGLIVLPGVMGVCGLWPNLDGSPERYNLSGTGMLGSPWGIGPLLFLGLLSGWSMVLLVVDIFRLKDGFWHIYDHVWCIAALVAGIFFVADAGVSQNQREFDQNIDKISKTSLYLLGQVELYDDWCRKSGHISLASCQWASLMQYKLSDYAYSSEFNFSLSSPPQSTAQIYGGGHKEASADDMRIIRMEIAAYNRVMCPVTDLGNGFSQSSKPSMLCKPTPIQLSEAIPEPLNGKESKYSPLTPTALASELLVPNLIRLGKIQKRLTEEALQNKRNKHFRWLYYLFFSVVVGGKVANSTAKMVDMSGREDKETRRSLHLIRHMALLLWRGCKTALSATRSLLALMVIKLRGYF